MIGTMPITTTGQKSINCQNPKKGLDRPEKKAQQGLVDQLEDRRLCKAKALGSNPNKSISVHQASNVAREG